MAQTSLVLPQMSLIVKNNMRSRLSKATDVMGRPNNYNISSNGRDTPRVRIPGSQLSMSMPLKPLKTTIVTPPSPI
jgi:hypothetical protein